MLCALLEPLCIFPLNCVKLLTGPSFSDLPNEMDAKQTNHNFVFFFFSSHFYQFLLFFFYKEIYQYYLKMRASLMSIDSILTCPTTLLLLPPTSAKLMTCAHRNSRWPLYQYAVSFALYFLARAKGHEILRLRVFYLFFG